MIEHLQAIAIHAYYAGEHPAGRRACDKILAMPGVSIDVAMQARANRTWYTLRLDELACCRFQRVEVEPAHDGWSLFNPTIIRHSGRWIGIVRSSNYRIQDGRYVMPEADGQLIRTENLLVEYSEDLLPISCRPITVDYPATGYPVTGLEDCRLRHTPTGLGLSATVRDVSPFDGRCRMATGDIDLAAGTVTGLRVLDGLQTQTHEKNWMPIEGRGGWLYSCHHSGYVVTVDQDQGLDGGWQMVQRRPSPGLALGFRGGSQLVPFQGGYLCLIHEVAHLPARVYEHRFAWFDAALTLASISEPFSFLETQAIEFAAGLAIDGDRVVASFGVRDAEAWLVELSGGDVWRLLSPATSG